MGMLRAIRAGTLWVIVMCAGLAAHVSLRHLHLLNAVMSRLFVSCQPGHP